MKAKLTISRFWRLLRRLFSVLLFYAGLLLLILLLILQIGTVQTFVAGKVLSVLSDQTDHQITLDKVQIGWLDQAKLKHTLVRDYLGDTLFYAENLEVNYSLIDLIREKELGLDEIDARNLLLRLLKYEGAEKLNLTVFLNSLKKERAEKESIPIRINEIDVSQMRVELKDFNKQPTSSRMDFANLNFMVSDLLLEDLAVVSDTIFGNLVQFSASEQNSGFELDELSTVFRISNTALSVDDLNLKTPTSHITDSLEFFYNGLDDLAYFQDSVSFILHFDKTRISRTDIRILSGSSVLADDVTLDGIIWGTVGDFNIEEMRIGYGGSYLLGGMSCFGLPDLKKTFVLADISDSRVLPRDLRPYIGSYTDNLRQMGRIDFKGSYAGFFKDFVARGDFYTDQGSVHSDINIKITDDFSELSYDGNLEFRKVNVGAFFKNEVVQEINLKANVKGKGITRKNADFDLEAEVYNSGLYGYEYDTVKANGHFANNFFQGAFAVQDPNCQLNGSGQIDFRGDTELLNLDLAIAAFNGDTLNLTKNGFQAKGLINIQLENLSIDDFVGSLSVDSTTLSLDGKEVVLDSIRLAASLVGQSRIIDLGMPGLDARVQGEFRVTDALKDLTLMYKDYKAKLTVSLDSVQSLPSGESYKLDVLVKIDDINSYLDSLKLPIGVFGNTILEGDFRQGKSAHLSFFFQTDSISFKDNTLLEPTLEMNVSEDFDSRTILTNLIFQSSAQRLKGVPDTEKLLLEGVWFDNIVDFTAKVEQPETKSSIRLESAATIFSDSLVLKVLPSDLQFLGDRWRFKVSNRIVVQRDQVKIHDFQLYESEESIGVNGVYSDSIGTNLSIAARNLDLNKTELVTDKSLRGLLDGDFNIARQNQSDPYRFEGGFSLSNLVIDELDIGDITGISTWDPLERSIYSKVEVDRDNFNKISAEGFYFPYEKEELDYSISFEKADLSLGQSLLKENFTSLSGFASGNLDIAGSLKAPIVVGKCRVENGNVIINYLKTRYNFEGEIAVTPNEIKLEGFNLRDRKGSLASVSGAIRHRQFKNLLLDVRMDANNFEFLNTTAVDNELYYGSAYGTGNIAITGRPSDLKIAASIKTEQNTKLFIPISENTSSGQQDYISFVDFSDTTVYVEEEDFNISGLTLDFDIEITPDAYCELIFDIKTGDIIRGRGRGNLKLSLNTDGEFNMFGPLEITEGAYNFTVPNFINKEFAVGAGSRITWYGDPYNAILDLKANYLQRASFEELNNPENQDPDKLSTRVPILVILELTGGILAPEISFDLELQNPADATQDNVPLMEQIVADEQELKRQVISLLFLKRFSPRESFTLSGGGSVGNSVSEFLSSQVSYLISQIDENLEVEVDLADLNRDAFNTFQLRFAYTFLDGRLKVTRGGDFGNQADDNENVFNDIVGDWSVEYNLTSDGRLRAKAFRNSSQRILQDNQQNQETGISLRFVQSFNNFSELLSLKRDEAILRRKEEEEKQAQARKDAGAK